MLEAENICWVERNRFLCDNRCL